MTHINQEMVPKQQRIDCEAALPTNGTDGPDFFAFG